MCEEKDLDINSYIKNHTNMRLKRLFHSNLNIWKLNLKKEINGTYRMEDAITFIDGIFSKNGGN